MKPHKTKLNSTAAFGLLCCLFSLGLSAQNRTNLGSQVPVSQLKFSIHAPFYNALQLSHHGEHILTSRPCISGEVAIGYYQEIADNWGVNLGAGWGMLPFNFRFPSPDDHSTERFTDYAINYYFFPLSIQRNLQIKPNRFLSLELGARLYSFLNYPYQVSVEFSRSGAQNGLPNYELDVNLYDTGKKYFVSGFAKVGWLKHTKRTNTLGINLVANYSPEKVGWGTYNWGIKEKPTWGTVKLGINYVGLEFVYGWSLHKKYSLKKVVE